LLTDGRLGCLRPIAVAPVECAPSSSRSAPPASGSRAPDRSHGGAITGIVTLLLGLALALITSLAAPVAPADALAVADLPEQPPTAHVLDTAGVLSRSGGAEIEKLLEGLSSERVDARLITVNHLDYGLSLDQLGSGLLDRWRDSGRGSGPQGSSPLLLLLVDTQTRATAVVAEPVLERQLPEELLRSTARTTFAQPLKQGDRYRQATVDALQRLTTVLRGSEDPGEPELQEAPVVVSNIPSKEETAGSNAFTWVIVLLVVGSVVPMLTWWVFSR